MTAEKLLIIFLVSDVESEEGGVQNAGRFALVEATSFLMKMMITYEEDLEMVSNTTREHNQLEEKQTQQPTLPEL